MAMLKATQLFFEVRGPRREDVVRFPLRNENEWQVEIGYSPIEEWIYELRIPLSSSDENPIDFNAKPGSTIGLTIEVGAVNRKKPVSGRNTTVFGGRGGRGGRSGEGPDGGRRSGGSPRADRGNRQSGTALKYWTRLTLAEQK